MSVTPAVNSMLAQVPLLSIQAAAFAKALEIARASPFALFCIATANMLGMGYSST